MTLQRIALCPILVHRTDAPGPDPLGLTTRLGAELGWAVPEQQRWVSGTAALAGPRWPVLQAGFAQHVRVPLSAPPPLVTVPGTDETTRQPGNPIWA
jgi:hypothetical protein